MIGFLVDIFVYGLRFQQMIPGYKTDYTKEQLEEIKNRRRNDIQEKLDNMGFVN